MSYRNPKYTYQSHASYYQNLIDAGVKAGSKITENENTKKETARKINQARVGASRGANQAFVTKGVQSNTYGNQTTKGAIGSYFENTGPLIGDLTMQTTGPDAPCEANGNCAELTSRLATLNKAPGVIKDFTENMLSQVDYSKLENFDENQGGNFILAANILQGADATTPAYGYSYNIEEGMGEEDRPDGSYNWVFKFDETAARKQLAADGKTEEEINEMMPGLRFDGKDSFSINSAGLAQQTANGGSVFVDTPKMSNEMEEIVSASGFMTGTEKDSKGKIIPGTGSFDIKKFKLQGDDGYDQISVVQEGVIGEGDNAQNYSANYNLIDENKIKNAMQNEINTKMDYFGQQQNQGSAIALWNKVLSDVDITDINVEEVEKAIGYKPTEEDLQTWDYNNSSGLSEKQLGLFKHLYEKYAVNEVYKLMTHEAYKTQRAYKPSEKRSTNPDFDKGKF
jgi:hypothetical protein